MENISHNMVHANDTIGTFHADKINAIPQEKVTLFDSNVLFCSFDLQLNLGNEDKSQDALFMEIDRRDSTFMVIKFDEIGIASKERLVAFCNAEKK